MCFNIFIFCYIGEIVTEQVICQEIKCIEIKKYQMLIFFNNLNNIFRKKVKYNIVILMKKNPKM